ncbi:MAG: universal stress protein [Bacteroidota bacterium]
MKRILIPTDFSKNSWNAIKYAIRFFRAVNCTFYLLHVANLNERPIHNLSFGIPMSSADIPTKNQLESILENAKGCTNPKHHKWVPLLQYGYLIDMMRRQIVENKIDLVVMGTKGASGLKKLIIGSNTGDVITKVHCNTLVVPEDVRYQTPREILFPTDYNTFYSNIILDTMSELIQRSTANLSVLHIAKSNGDLSENQKINRKYLKDYLDEILLKNNGFHLIKGDNTVKEIQKFVVEHKIDFMVMVAKNLNFLQQILFDSTVEKVSFHTKVPFFIIHE